MRGDADVERERESSPDAQLPQSNYTPSGSGDGNQVASPAPAEPMSASEADRRLLVIDAELRAARGMPPRQVVQPAQPGVVDLTGGG